MGNQGRYLGGGGTWGRNSKGSGGNWVRTRGRGRRQNNPGSASMCQCSEMEESTVDRENTPCV